ncbi:DUF2017 family protein [Microbacterium hydrocarbonoxydans]|uniref:Uncharacterized protein n=1 Tax=Microbacterium hydrocarbonoxydans TaxID=273678 RepID=A0A1H4MFA2_9MICO|nr:DUF2017 family protein [Microbacterium hydrocarbonoxydans]SEB81709.1 protein of unknown function [Microbacterium hydrocarbonoxydans]
MTETPVQLKMARVEGAQLAQLVDDLRELVGADRDPSDPAIGRLVPDAYPQDEDAAQAFRDATREDLLDRRAHDADVVRAALAALRGDLASMSQEEAFAEHEIAIPLPDIDAWLRTLTALRLIIASRLGIEDDDDRDEDDARYGVYDWLGYRLELLIDAADQVI